MKKWLSVVLIGLTLPTLLAGQVNRTLTVREHGPTGRLFAKPKSAKDTLWLKVGQEHVRAVPVAPAKPWPGALTVKVDINTEAGYFNAQGQTAGLSLDGTNFRYSIDGGQTWQGVAWAWKLPPGTYTVRCEFTRPGLLVGYAEKTFILPPKQGGSAPAPNLPDTPGKTDPTPKPKPDENRQEGGGITMGGVELKNADERVDRGTYWLQYRPMPGSQRLRYVPRVVLKQHTNTHSAEPEKLDPFDLTKGDLVMWFVGRTPAHDFEKLLTRGVSHIDSRAVFGAGNGNVDDPNRPGRDIPWTRRAHMTMSNNFDWIPAFQRGDEMTPEQLAQLVPWIMGDGVSNYFTDGQPPQWHLKDWEFKFNANSWGYLSQTYKRAYAGTGRYLHNWMGPSQTNYRFEDYDAWPMLGYFHQTDWLVPNCNFSDGQASSLECWKQKFHADAHNLLQSLDRPERFLADYPQAQVLSGWMTHYEDGSSGDERHAYRYRWEYGKIHPTLAETAPTWHLLAARSTGKAGGLVFWNAPFSNEPATAEQLALCGYRRLAFLNEIRAGAYQWVKPLVTLAGQPERGTPNCVGYDALSSLGYQQVRDGQVVKEPMVRCLVTAAYVVVFAQNPHPDAPDVQTFRVRLPGIGFDDLVTVHKRPKTLGALAYDDKELTIAVAQR